MNTDKITPQHKERSAIVYVRQSSLSQVLHNHESRQRQYDQEAQARALGFRTVTVIDDDLGRSGSGLVERPGFACLLERICSGVVGAVFALEASRLARNNRDWACLIDLCAMTDTLVIDHDGVYDARLLNDRLLLGLKGTMSEFELGLLRQRALEALRRKIARGEVLHVPPVGYVRTEDNRLELTPDLQIQQAIRGVFARFRACGSARQVLIQFRQEGVRLPTIDPAGTQVVWRLPVLGRILRFLKNPTYAGVYGYGRRTRRTIVQDGRQQRSGRRDREQKDWTVLLEDHHPGYITWADYEQNQQMLLDNTAARDKMRTAAKQGAALLVGLMRCGHCGRPMQTEYTGTERKSPRYLCASTRKQQGGHSCLEVGGLRIDQAVSAAVLSSLQTVALEASLEAERLAAEQRRQSQDTIRLALEKARYEADRCRRQFEAIEPENRLVATELERRWNTALGEVARLDAARQEKERTDAPVAAEELGRLRALGPDVTAAWHQPNAPVELKKRILRTVLKEIIVRVDPFKETAGATAESAGPDPALQQNPTKQNGTTPAALPQRPVLTLTLHWEGGAHTALQMDKPTRANLYSTNRDSIELIRELAQGLGDDRIAMILNRGGHRTGKGLLWKAHSVIHVRGKYDIPTCKGGPTRTWITLQQASKKLGICSVSVRKLITAGVLPAQQIVAHAPWFIAPESLNLPEVTRIVANLKQTGLLVLPNESQANLELHLS